MNTADALRFDRKNYTLVHRKYFEEDEPPFILSIASGDVYASRDMTESQLRRLVRDINEALDDYMPDMQHGDLGLEDPDDIAF